MMLAFGEREKDQILFKSGYYYLSDVAVYVNVYV